MVFNPFPSPLRAQYCFEVCQTHTQATYHLEMEPHKQPRCEPDGERRGGCCGARCEDAGLNLPMEMLWFRPHRYEGWQSSKEPSLLQAAELTETPPGPETPVKEACSCMAQPASPAVQHACGGLRISAPLTQGCHGTSDATPTSSETSRGGEARRGAGGRGSQNLSARVWRQSGVHTENTHCTSVCTGTPFSYTHRSKPALQSGCNEPRDTLYPERWTSSYKYGWSSIRVSLKCSFYSQ